MVVEMNCIVTGYLYCRDIAELSLTTFFRIPSKKVSFHVFIGFLLRLREKVN